MADPPGVGGESSGAADEESPTTPRRDVAQTLIATGGDSPDAAERASRASEGESDTLLAGRAPARGKHFSRLTAGDRVGRYRIEGPLGAGGMGAVYLAHDPDLDRRVAIKVLHSQLGGNAQSAGSQRLLREAQAMARLSHPNVVTVHDVGVVGESLFIAMELIDGDDLRGWLAARPRSWREIVAAFVEAGQGLEAAHAAEIIHRDFKPDNVMVAASGRICVGDFGLAAGARTPQEASAATREDEGDLTTSWLASAGTLTVPGAVMGTPAYMAPEQMVGGVITPAADIFAFCVALYEALYDQRPFAGKTVAALYLSISQGEIAAVGKGARGAPRRLERLLRRGLALEPEDRPPSMAVVLAELRPLVAPKALRRLALATIGAAAVATGAALWSVGEDETVTCDGGADEVAQIWSSARQAELLRALEETGVIHAEETWGRVSASVERTLSRWQDARREACEETHHSAQFSEEILALRVACLGRQLGEVDALLGFLGEADPQVVDNAVRLVSGVPDPRTCDPAEVLVDAARGRTRSPELDALEAELAGAVRLHQAGKYAEALEVLDRLHRAAMELGDADFEAELLVQLSHTAYVDHRADAGELLREALEANLRAGRDRDFAKVAADKLGLVAAEPEERVLWLQLGEAALARSEEREGSLDSVLAKLKTNYGNGLRNSGRPREALVFHREALRLHRRVDETSYLVGDGVFNVASSLAWLERYDEAAALVREATTIWERELGPKHPRMIKAHRSLALLSKSEGDNEGALKAAREMLARSQELWGEGDRRLVDSLVIVAVIQVWMGDFVGAAEDYERALAIVQAHPPGPDSEALYMMYADLEVSRGNLDRGEELLGLAAAVVEERSAEEPFWAEYYALRTELALRRGDLAAAQRDLDSWWARLKDQESLGSASIGYFALRAAELAVHRGRIAEGLTVLALFESQHPLPLLQPLLRGTFLWARARLLHRAGRESRARADATEALAHLEPLGVGYEPLRADIRGWLEAL